MRSDNMKKGTTRLPHRSIFKSLGFTDLEINRPIIGVVNSFNELIPGHMHLRSITEAVKAGIRIAGGTPQEFATIGVCDAGASVGGIFTADFGDGGYYGDIILAAARGLAQIAAFASQYHGGGAGGVSMFASCFKSATYADYWCYYIGIDWADRLAQIACRK